jgi:hypothetical protein
MEDPGIAGGPHEEVLETNDDAIESGGAEDWEERWVPLAMQVYGPRQGTWWAYTGSLGISRAQFP